MKVTLSLTTRSSNDEVATKSFGKINPKYITMIGEPSGGSSPVIIPPSLPRGFETLANWADTLMRNLNSLSTRTYVNSKVLATWDINEEVAD